MSKLNVMTRVQAAAVIPGNSGLCLDSAHSGSFTAIEDMDGRDWVHLDGYSLNADWQDRNASAQDWRWCLVGPKQKQPVSVPQCRPSSIPSAQTGYYFTCVRMVHMSCTLVRDVVASQAEPYTWYKGPYSHLICQCDGN